MFVFTESLKEGSYQIIFLQKLFTGLDKQAYSLFKFDLVDFYPCISEELVIKSLNFANSYTNVAAEDLSLIRNACKSVLSKQGNIWRKKRPKNNSLFNVAQGYYMGEEIFSC